jgi:hypothetical protein
MLAMTKVKSCGIRPEYSQALMHDTGSCSWTA